MAAGIFKGATPWMPSHWGTRGLTATALVLALLVAIAPGGAPILKYGVAVQVLAELGRLVRMPVASSRMCTTCQEHARIQRHPGRPATDPRIFANILIADSFIGKLQDFRGTQESVISPSTHRFE